MHLTNVQAKGDGKLLLNLKYNRGFDGMRSCFEVETVVVVIVITHVELFFELKLRNMSV